MSVVSCHNMETLRAALCNCCSKPLHWLLSQPFTTATSATARVRAVSPQLTCAPLNHHQGFYPLLPRHLHLATVVTHQLLCLHWTWVVRMAVTAGHTTPPLPLVPLDPSVDFSRRTTTIARSLTVICLLGVYYIYIFFPPYYILNIIKILKLYWDFQLLLEPNAMDSSLQIPVLNVLVI